MNNFYFTFGFGHKDYDGNSLAHMFVKVTADNYMKARILMVNKYGIKWAFQYEEDNFLPQIEQFGLTELEHIIQKEQEL